jgi:hypothetical protein
MMPNLAAAAVASPDNTRESEPSLLVFRFRGEIHF